MKSSRLPKRLGLSSIAMVLTFNLAFMGLSHAAFNQNNIIDNQVFDNTTAMDVGQVNSFLNSLPNSCISQNKGFSAPDPTGYSQAGGFTYGGAVSAGQVIVDSAKTYGLNPQVLLTTLQKEQSLVDGGAGCAASRYAKAVGYGCPDSGGSYSYSYGSGGNLLTPLYYINGSPVNSPGSNICVNTAAKVGFSEQLIHAAWLLKFGEQRSEGNVSWNVQFTNFPQPGDSWNNSDDPKSCYSGPMTPGNFQVCPNGPTTYYDGSDTIDGTAVIIQNGATASLYWYTPHFAGNQNFSTIFTNWFGSTASCDFPKGSSAGLPNMNNNAGVVTLPGNWTSPSTQGFAYVTPNGSGGFDVAVMDPSTGSGVQWRGTWWSQTNPYIKQMNTVLIPAKNANGLTDLYYATSTNWSKPGFTVGLMHNNGHGFSYQGTQWVTTSLSLANTRFIPGNWIPGAGDQGFAYVTPNYSGGFDVGVMAPSPSGLQWRGTKWNQTNGSISFFNTVFVPADSDGDSLTDLYYATSVNWSKPGFSVGLMHNNGSSLTYGGPQWTNTSLNLGVTSFLPGNWTGGANQGFAYATQCGTRGFDLSVMTPSPSGLQWRGQWWHAPTVVLSNIDFIPADTDGDGYTDLYYATPNGNYGFSMALQRNNGDASFGWQGTQWSPTTIPLSTTSFLPSN